MEQEHLFGTMAVTIHRLNGLQTACGKVFHLYFLLFFCLHVLHLALSVHLFVVFLFIFCYIFFLNVVVRSFEDRSISSIECLDVLFCCVIVLDLCSQLTHVFVCCSQM
jgi:hypothetical protein